MKLETTSVRRDIWVRASVKKVWKALTDPEKRKQWDAWNANIDLQVGGKVFIQHGWGAVTSSTISEIVDEEKLVLSSEDGAFQNITTLTPEGEGVRVIIEYRMSWGAVDESMKENMAFGTYRFLQNLKSVMEDGTDLRPTFWPTTLGIKHTSHRGKTLGTEVLHVNPDSPASVAGLHVGDVIIAANNQSIRNYDDLEIVLQNSAPCDVMTLDVIRNGENIDVETTLAAYPRSYKE